MAGWDFLSQDSDEVQEFLGGIEFGAFQDPLKALQIPRILKAEH
jgi:hypothetical protein